MRRALRAAVVGMATVVAVNALGVAPAAAQVEPDEWTSSVCTSLTDWANELSDLSDGFDPPPNATPRRIKAILVEFLGGAVDASETLIDDIKAAGYPDVDDGKAVAKVFTKGVTRAREIFAEAESDAKKLPTTTASRFETQARRIERALDRGGKEVESLFDEAQDRYSVPRLNRAFDDEPACEDLS